MQHHNKHNKDTGIKGENIATDYLLLHGFTIIERNWRYKYWEIDIIASKGNLLHFIEVKTRTNERFGKPEESINETKMNALKNAASEYLHRHIEWKNIVFDVIAITLKNTVASEILFIEDVYF